MQQCYLSRQMTLILYPTNYHPNSFLEQAHNGFVIKQVLIMRYQCFKKNSEMGKDIYRRDTYKTNLETVRRHSPKYQKIIGNIIHDFVFESCVLVEELHEEVYRILQRREIFS